MSCADFVQRFQMSVLGGSQHPDEAFFFYFAGHLPGLAAYKAERDFPLGLSIARFSEFN